MQINHDFYSPENRNFKMQHQVSVTDGDEVLQQKQQNKPDLVSSRALSGHVCM